MNPLPGIFLLAIAMGAGAFTHHLTENSRESTRGQRSIRGPVHSGPKRSRLPRGIVQLADELIPAAQETARPVNWILLDETLSSLTADQFPPLCRELTGRHNGTLKEALIEYWAAADAKTLLACAGQSEFGFKLEDVVASCFRCAPDAVVAAIMHCKVTGGRDNEIENLWRLALNSQPAGDSSAILALAAKHGVFKKDEVPFWVAHRMRTWAGNDPRTAVPFAQQHAALLNPALQGWVASDPQAALEWMRQHPGPGLPASSMDSALGWFAGTHPKEAGRFIDQVEDKLEFYKAQAKGMAAVPVSESAAWVRTLSTNERMAAYIVLTEELTKRDPAAAAAFCSQLPELAPELSTDHVVVAWAARDPAATMRWLQSGQVPDSVRERRLPDLIKTWLVIDRSAALEFINAQPPSEAVGQVMLEASQILTDGDAESARDFALGLPEPALRLGACRGILNTRFWQRNANPEEANAQAVKWIAAIPDATIRKEMEAELARRLPQAPVP